MIFERLFKAKHLHSDPDTRIQAIESLSLDKASDKQALHELAFNDSDARVSLAALDKLNSFALWLKASETAENSRIKKRAYEKVLAEVNNPDSNLISASEFAAFVAESKNTNLLEDLLSSNRRLQENDALALASLLKIDKVNTTRLYFREHANQAQQLVIVNRTSDINELSKLLKFSQFDVVVAAAEKRINELKELEAKPIKLKQDATLVISKMLALKDQNDYEYIYEHRQGLVSQFETLKKSFSILDEESALILAEKYLRVGESLEKRLAALKGEWQSANELKETTNALAEIENRFNQVKQQIDAILASIDDPSLLAQSKLLSNALEDIASDVEDARNRPQTTAHKRHIKQIVQHIEQYRAFLIALPEAKENKVKAMALLTELEGLSEGLTTQELNEALHALKKQWQALLSDLNLPLPESVLSAWKTAEKKYRSTLISAFEEIKQQEKKAVGKLLTVQRMIRQGSYKPAISTFRHAKAQFEGLPEKAQRAQQKLFDELSDKVTELQELQAFIAAPRKPALLEDAMKLANEKNIDDLGERAKQVKVLRSDWNGLGKLGTEEDDELNKRFDEALEQAFAPCREHYAEQEKLRAENAKVAEQLIQQLSALQEQENVASLGRSLSALNKKWREIGVLEHDQRKRLQKDYYAAQKPIQVKLDQYYAENAEQKQQLVTRAERLNDSEDLTQAVDQAKQFQQQWKALGFAGKNIDDKLWKAFRAANDKVFAKLNEKRDEQAGEISASQKLIADILQPIHKAIDAANDSASLAELTEQTNSAKVHMSELPPKLAKIEGQKIERVLENINDKSRALDKQRSEAQWDSLFTTLAAWKSGENEDVDLPDTFEQLPKRFQSLFKQSNTASADRKAITIQAEVLHDLPSNKADEKQRKELQLQMMASKLEGNEPQTLQTLLADWVSHGPLQKEDQALLKRLKKVFEAQ